MAMAFQVAFLLNRAVEDVLGIPRMPTFTDEQERRYPTRLFAARCISWWHARQSHPYRARSAAQVRGGTRH